MIISLKDTERGRVWFPSPQLRLLLISSEVVTFYTRNFPKIHAKLGLTLFDMRGMMPPPPQKKKEMFFTTVLKRLGGES